MCLCVVCHVLCEAVWFAFCVLGVFVCVGLFFVSPCLNFVCEVLLRCCLAWFVCLCCGCVWCAECVCVCVCDLSRGGVWCWCLCVILCVCV